LRAQDRVVAAGKRHDRALGRLVDSVAAGEAVYRAGFDVICYGGDIWTSFAAVSEGVAGLKAACAVAPADVLRQAGQGTKNPLVHP
jgi:2-dehydro-3-deoxyglucarate aldolase/4-hydroxy-2-oxoheptanedioate aldolase